jgi:hypothetical protein
VSARAEVFRFQVRSSDGIYRNPFKRGGYGSRWGKWLTKLATPALQVAIAALEAHRLGGLEQARVVGRGGRMYARRPGALDLREVDRY